MFSFFFFLQGVATSICQLDWQLARVSSPAVDISNYLISATEKPLRDAHMEEFLSIYYNNFANTIRSTGSNPDLIYPLTEFKLQMQTHSIYGLLLAPILLSIMVSNASDIANMDDLSEAVAKGEADSASSMVQLDKKTENLFVGRLKAVIDDARTYGWLQ